MPHAPERCRPPLGEHKASEQQTPSYRGVTELSTANTHDNRRGIIPEAMERLAPSGRFCVEAEFPADQELD
jgi:hypothetical protein